jgi:GT2 family glycosyltransferase
MILSIVIANWNTKDKTEQCLESLFNSINSSADAEVIVIDNGSSDGSVDFLKGLGSRINLICNSSNLGYAKACNQGMKAAKGKYILLLGSDTVLMEDTLEKCIGFMETSPQAGAAGCRLLNPDGSLQNSCKKFPLLKNAFYTYLSLDKLNQDYDMSSFKYDSTREVEQIAATFLMIRSSVLKEVGLFDESYGILYNDVDLCKRIYRKGYKLFFLHTCSVIHHGSHSTKKAGFGLRKKMYGDIYRYYKNNFGFKAMFLYPILALRLLIVSSIKA